MSAIRSRRSLRAVGLILALTAPIVAASALPAAAAGESADAVLTAPTSDSASTFTWSYTFGGGTHGLSNIAIGFCSADILADVVSATPGATVYDSGDVGGGHTDFGPGIKFAVTATTGTFSVTFGSPHPIAVDGLRIQSHSGDGQDGDIVNLADGPGTCASDNSGGDNSGGDNSGGDNSGGDNSGGDNSGGNNSGGNNSGGNNSGGNNSGDPTITSDPAQNTVVLPATLEQTPSTPAVLPAAVVQTSSPTLKPRVLGETLVEGADLPRTGSSHLTPMVALALALITAGTALLAGFRRRVGSAVSPG